MRLLFICPTANTPCDEFCHLRLIQSFQRYRPQYSLIRATSLADVPWSPDTVVFYDRYLVARHENELSTFYDRERALLMQRRAQVRGRLIVAATGDGTYGWMIRRPDPLLQELAACLFYHSKRKDFDTSGWPWLAEHSFAVQGPPVYRLQERVTGQPYAARVKQVYWLGTASGIWDTRLNDRLIAMKRFQEALPTNYTFVVTQRERDLYRMYPEFMAVLDGFLALKSRRLFTPVDRPVYLAELARQYFLLGSYGNTELSVRYVDAAVTGTVLLSPNLENMGLIGDWKAGANYYDLGNDGLSRLPDFIEDCRSKPDFYWEEMARNCALLYERFYAIGPDEAHTPETFNEFLRRLNAIAPLF